MKAAISDLCLLNRFLDSWYSIVTYSKPKLKSTEDAIQNELPVPEPLNAIWLSNKKLFKGYTQWLNDGTPSPLACQDALVAPGFLKKIKGNIPIVVENQGNWIMAYKDRDKSEDPKIHSNFMSLENSRLGFLPTGGRLSNLIITSALTETVFFSAVNQERAAIERENCTEELWTGFYYNALGVNGYEKPSHRIMINKEKTMLALYIHDEFSGFVGDKSLAISRYNKLNY